METEIDRLKEVCEIAKNVQIGEKEIEDIETQIANRMREIVARIFDGSVKYRMKQQRMDYYGGDKITVWADISICLKDNVVFYESLVTYDSFYGDWTGLRITTNGIIMVVTQTVVYQKSYRIDDGDLNISSDNPPRNASDHEIASHAQELAEKLLEALRRRIDDMKEEKATLQRVAQVILQKEVK